MSDAYVQLDDVHKWFGEFHALKGVSLSVGLGSKVVACGPSGSEQSTMIRCINGLEFHDQGSIIVDGVALTDVEKEIDEIRREVGMVFQEFRSRPTSIRASYRAVSSSASPSRAPCA